MILTPWPKVAFLGNNGRPLVGGQLFTYVAGTNTKIATYTDDSGMSQNTNPVVLDFRGEANVWLDPTLSYKFVLSPRDDTDPPTNPIWTVDNISPLGGLTQEVIGRILWPLTEAEEAAGITDAMLDYSGPQGYIPRYRIVANAPGSASSNQAAIARLMSIDTVGPTGDFYFPNLTGEDIYYFTGPVTCRPGIHIDAGGCTLNFTGTGTADDSVSGMFFALYDFSFQNGTVVIDWDTDVSTSSGNAFQFGARGSDSLLLATAYPSGVYDNDLDAPMGNCRVQDTKIRSTITGAGLDSAAAIALVGGLQNIVLENIDVDGGGDLKLIVTYEFGWATSGTVDLRQTSHMHNFRFTNIRATNTDPDAIVVTIGAGYNGLIQNVYGAACAGLVVVTPGESLFYRPWVDVDTTGAKRTILIENCVGQDVTGTFISIIGAQSASGGYLATLVAGLGHPADYIAQTDLEDVEINGCTANGTDSGFGILCSADRAKVKGCTLTGFQSAIFGTAEWTKVEIEGNNITGCTQVGLNLSSSSAIWSPSRQRTGFIRENFIAGNSTSNAGAFPGIQLALTASMLVEANRLGYQSAHDGVAETTQGNHVQLAADCAGVVCNANYVGDVTVGNFAYFNSNNTAPSLGNAITNPLGTFTYSGIWDNTLQSVNLTLTAATPGDIAVTYANRVFEYIKSGSRIDYSFRVETSAFTYTTATGNVRITGLPYAVNNSSNWIDVSGLLFSGITKANYTQFAMIGIAGQSRLEMQASAQAQALANVAITDFPTGGTVILRASGHYFV